MLVAVLVSAALLVWSAVANLVFGEQLYVLRNLIAMLLLLAVARASGASARDLGWSREGAVTGVRWGAAAAVVVLAAVMVGVMIGDRVGVIGSLLADERADLTPGAVWWNVLVRIPIGTALFEEVAFRGVLLASFLTALRTPWAVVWSSVVFGLWHIPPAIVALRINEVEVASAAGGRAIVGAVVVTAVAGVAFSWLRLASGSLLAPVLAHWATNGFGLLGAVVSGDADSGSAPSR